METPPVVHRHKTAIRRAGFSLPVRCLLRDGLLGSEQSLFDYGCGRGQDLDLLRDLNIPCEGWDPVHRPHGAPAAADVVNLGFVINVIENPGERAEVLQRAWSLCRELLVVAAQLDSAASDRDHSTLADGILTSRGTFQKYYSQSELRAYLERTLAADALPAAPGVFYVFREESARQRFLANRFHRAVSVPRERVSEKRFEQHREILEPFMQALARLGRLPGPEEVPDYGLIVERLGSAKRALALVNRVTGADAWASIAVRRAEDLLVYLALSRFPRRPPLSALPVSTQRDAKAFFGTYARACSEADALLFKVGEPGAIDAACCRSPVGRLVENALLLHRSALAEVEPLLRIYEGCARALVGEVEEADVIKLHRFSGKVSYLAYRDFDTEPHPALRQRVKVTLPTLSVDFFNHANDSPESLLDAKEGLFPPAENFVLDTEMARDV